MKIRIGFITNSSSSSFIIHKKNLSPKQIKAVVNHEELSLQMGWGEIKDWNITQTENTIRGYTSMDNYDISEFLGRIGISNSDINWDEFDFYDEDDSQYDNKELEKTWEELLDEI